MQILASVGKSVDMISSRFLAVSMFQRLVQIDEVKSKIWISWRFKDNGLQQNLDWKRLQKKTFKETQSISTTANFEHLGS